MRAGRGNGWKLFQAVILFVFLAATARAQLFTNSGISLGPNVPITFGMAAFGDYDNDGFLDLAIAGGSGTNTQIFHNNGNGTFSEISTSVTQLSRGSLIWADFNNDGMVDLLVSGFTNASTTANGFVQVWKNNGSNFVLAFNLTITNVGGTVGPSAVVGDFDNDGLPDLFIISSDANGGIWRNVGNFGFVQLSTAIPTVQLGSDAVVMDLDNDGWLDLALSAQSGSNIIYRNINGTNFVTTATFQPAANAAFLRTVAADINSDGREDLAIAPDPGAISADYSLNTGGAFSEIGSLVMGGASSAGRPFLAFGDFQNDGFPDFVGVVRNGPISYYHNNGDTTFSSVTNAGIEPANGASASGRFGAVGDYDNDGRLDLIYDADLPPPTLGIFRNISPVTNTTPTAPSGLKSVVQPVGTNVLLTWSPASDAQTPTAALSYNIRVGTTPGGVDVVSPMSDIVTGRRRVVGIGNARERVFALLQKLRAGVTYYWSVQAVDSAFAGGPWAPEAQFTALPPLAGDINGDGVVSQSELETVVSNYLATSPFLLITNTAGLGGTNITFSVTNFSGVTFSVEYSTNLTDWLPAGTAQTQFIFSDPNATTSPTRFYRLRFP